MSEPCPVCGGTGFEVRLREDGTGEARPCSCLRPRQAERLLRAARIPRRYDHCALQSAAADSQLHPFEIHHDSHREALGVARDWVERWPLVEQGLLLLGPPGTGKTHLAVGVARELAAKGARIRFHEQRELLKTLQSTYGADSTLSETDVLQGVSGAEVLILDDVGAGRVTDWARDVLHDIIVHRYNQKLPLIMTSNRAAGEPAGDEAEPRSGSERLSLRDCLGDALMSRIYEMCRIVAFAGEDYRRGVLHAHHRF